jgi:hypothetical protein
MPSELLQHRDSLYARERSDPTSAAPATLGAIRLPAGLLGGRHPRNPLARQSVWWAVTVVPSSFDLRCHSLLTISARGGSAFGGYDSPLCRSVCFRVFPWPPLALLPQNLPPMLQMPKSRRSHRITRTIIAVTCSQRGDYIMAPALVRRGAEEVKIKTNIKTSNPEFRPNALGSKVLRQNPNIKTPGLTPKKCCRLLHIVAFF